MGEKKFRFLKKKFVNNTSSHISEEKSINLWDDVMALNLDSLFSDFKNLLLEHE